MTTKKTRIKHAPNLKLKRLNEQIMLLHDSYRYINLKSMGRANLPKMTRKSATKQEP